MKKDLEKIQFLKIKGCDNVDDTFLNNCLIDLRSERHNCIVEGKWIDPSYEIDLAEPTEYPLKVWMKVVDMGYYTLLDENENILYELAGYVPDIVDYFNNQEGYGDYIDLDIEYDEELEYNVVKIPERNKNEDIFKILDKSLNRDGWQKVEE